MLCRKRVRFHRNYNSSRLWIASLKCHVSRQTNSKGLRCLFYDSSFFFYLISQLLKGGHAIMLAYFILPSTKIAFAHTHQPHILEHQTCFCQLLTIAKKFMWYVTYVKQTCQETWRIDFKVQIQIMTKAALGINQFCLEIKTQTLITFPFSHFISNSSRFKRELNFEWNMLNSIGFSWLSLNGCAKPAVRESISV